jgi:hypothetical protein
VTLARNSDVWEIAQAIRQVEDRFNRNFHYDWVFLNDQPFDDNFKRITTSLVSGTTRYGEIPKEHWSYPDWIDQDRAREVREEMKEKKIIYGHSESYRHMCRYESGFFFRHPLLQEYEFYWRIEPGVELFCDIPYDPFLFMKENDKKYSFVMSMYEYEGTIPTLWDSVKQFIDDHPEHIAEGNSLRFLSDDNGKTYNKCHFVSSLCLVIWFKADTQSGRILRSAAWIGSDPRSTWTTLTSSTGQAASTTRDGAMHLSIRSPPAYSSRKNNYTSGTRFPTTTYPLPIVLVMNNSEWTSDVAATHQETLTGGVSHVSLLAWPTRRLH